MSYADTIKPLALVFLIALAGLLGTGSDQSNDPQHLTKVDDCTWCDVPDSAIPGEKVAAGQDSTDAKGHFRSVRIVFDPQEINRTELVTLIVSSLETVSTDNRFCNGTPGFRTSIYISDGAEQAITIHRKRDESCSREARMNPDIAAAKSVG